MTTDHFTSLDETIRAIRSECETRVKEANDKLLAAQIEATLCRDLLAKATAEKERYMRVAERLITQFATVEKVFADAKAYALTLPEGSLYTAESTQSPPPDYESKK